MAARDRRRRFVAAAVTVIGEEGVARATTRRIAEVADAPPASLHYCFETKDELFQAVLEQGLADGLADARQDVSPNMSLACAIEPVLRGFARWMRSNPDVQLAQWELTLWALRSPSSRHIPARIYQRYLDGCVDLLRVAAGDQVSLAVLEAISRQIIGSLDGHGLQWVALCDDGFNESIDQAVLALQAWLPSLTSGHDLANLPLLSSSPRAT